MLSERQLEYFATAVAVTSVFLNAFLLCVMLKTKNIRENPANCFIFTILTFDLISGIYYTGYNYVGDPANGLPLVISFNFAVFFTLLTIQLAMSAERAWVVCFPLSYVVHKDDGYRKWIVMLSILLGFLFGLMYAVMLGIGGYVHEMNLKYKSIAVIWAIAFTAFILIFNGFVIYKTNKRGRTSLSLSENVSTDAFQSRLRQEKSINVTMMLIIASFLLCNTPNIFRLAVQAYTGNYGLYEVLCSYTMELETTEMCAIIITDISFFLPILNSVLDPLIYGTRMKSIRKAIKRTFKRNIPTETEQPTSTRATDM